MPDGRKPLPPKRPFWTGPNLLTLSRLPLAALAWVLPATPPFILGLMAVAGLTDVLDGWWERRRRRARGEEFDPATPGPGVWLDPLCDKIFVVSVLLALAAALRPPLYLLPLIAAREILQTLAAAGTRLVPAFRRRFQFPFRAAAIGKAATVFQFLSIAALLGRSETAVPLSIATGVLGCAAAGVYVFRAWKAGRPVTPPA